MKIYIISKPTISGTDEFLKDKDTIWQPIGPSTDAERLVEYCGRICYMSFGDRQSGRTTQEYVKNLIKQGHESVLEHASWTFIVDDVSRGFTHQLVRHRVGIAFSQLSQQYVDQSDERFFSFPLPDESEDLTSRIRAAFDDAKKVYLELRDEFTAIVDRSYPALSKKEKQRMAFTLARSILPNGTATTLAMTINARAARHILSVRGAIEGDLEMREFTAHLFAILEGEAPAIVSDFSLAIENGLPIVHRTKE